MLIDQNTAALAGVPQVFVLFQQAASIYGVGAINSAGSAASSALAAAAYNYEITIALNYTAANPGAAWFANLPKTLPGSSGVWWLNGGIVSKS
jgi:hypothetical protein